MDQSREISFRPLFLAAHYLAIVMLILIPLQVAVFVISPPPDTVLGFFEKYHENPFLGLLSLDFLYLFSNAIIIVLYLALFALLYRERPVSSLIALVFGLIGIACYYPSNPAFEMLTLSGQYFSAQPELRSIYLAAGEAVMAGYTGTAFDVYYVFNAICLLLFAQAVYRSPRFSRTAGLWGLVSGILMIVPSSAGLVGMVFSLLSLIPWVIFVALLMIRFKKFSVQRD